jgi:hypothetical protein
MEPTTFVMIMLYVLPVAAVIYIKILEAQYKKLKEKEDKEAAELAAKQQSNDA